MDTNFEMPRERRGRQASMAAKSKMAPPASAVTGEHEHAAGQASGWSQPKVTPPGRTNSDGAMSASEQATKPTKTSCSAPARTNSNGALSASRKANRRPKPKPGSPSCTITGLAAGCDPTNGSPKPTAHASDRTHSVCKDGAGRAIRGALPNEQAPDQQPIAGSAGGEMATCPAKPNIHAPSRTSRASGARRRGQPAAETQQQSAAAATLNPAANETNPNKASPDSDHVGHTSRETRTRHADVIATIRSLWRRRQAWHRAEKSLTLGIYAICRQFVGSQPGSSELSKTKFNTKAAEIKERATAGKLTDAEIDVAISVSPLIAARGQIEPMRLAIEKELGKLIKHLPATGWALAIPGIGPGSIFSVVGEAGDVGSYKSVSALWKRMGVAVVNGERQRRKSGADGIEHGFAPERGAVSFNVGGALIGRMGHGYRPKVGEDVGHLPEYQRLFVDRCRYLATREPETYAREPVEKDGVLRESYSKHCANSARRYVVKRFYRHLFAAWRSECGEVTTATKPTTIAPPRIQFAEAAE